jgi:uncharacterized protein (DUF433 family)
MREGGDAMTWEDCDLVERVPGKMSGRTVIKGTRIEPDTIVTDYDLGSPIEEIHENFPSVSVDTIEKLLAFAQRQQILA